MVTDLEQGDVSETVRKFYEESKHTPPIKKSVLSIYDVSWLQYTSRTHFKRKKVAFIGNWTQIHKTDYKLQGTVINIYNRIWSAVSKAITEMRHLILMKLYLPPYWMLHVVLYSQT